MRKVKNNTQLLSMPWRVTWRWTAAAAAALLLKLSRPRCGNTTLAAWRRRRRFVRDKLLSVNHRALINLRFRGAGRLRRPCTLTTSRARKLTWGCRATGKFTAGRLQRLLRPLGRGVVRTTFWMVIEADACDRGRWKLCAGRATLTSSRNPAASTHARKHADVCELK